MPDAVGDDAACDSAVAVELLDISCDILPEEYCNSSGWRKNVRRVVRYRGKKLTEIDGWIRTASEFIFDIVSIVFIGI